MKKYNPTKFDHEKQCVTIGRKSYKVVLRAILDKGQVSMITGGTMSKLFSKVKSLCLICSLSKLLVIEVIEEVNSFIQGVLSHYADVFVEPKYLPTAKSLDHTIPLKPGTSPVSLRPYIYKYNQKEEQKKVEEMLNNDIIQHSQSPFSSPVLLVKNKD